MINTYQSSVAPPPVPPRLHSSHQGAHPVLIPTPMLPQGNSRTLLRFMVAVVLLNLLMSILGFLYLYKNDKGQEGMPTSSLVAGPAASMQKQDSYHVTKRASHRVFARMVFLKPTPLRPQSGPLKWDLKHSRYSHPQINYYKESWLTIEEPGEYLVYSRITFSKASTVPLTTQVKWRKSEQDTEPDIIMQAFCSTALCTATAEDVIKLEKGNQLSVWTEDISLVRYDTATTFGLYNLWQ
uniref:CD40 ligand n=1 Tax=Neogobius melanostomus TaxID=47308 RepID=A0A8C6WIH2_9GOBI